jgi:hypothetical protein
MATNLNDQGWQFYGQAKFFDKLLRSAGHDTGDFVESLGETLRPRIVQDAYGDHSKSRIEAADRSAIDAETITRDGVKLDAYRRYRR